MTIKADTVIIGGGPCGLFAVFELGLHGVRAHLVESLPHVGGQCAELYPDKPIYDIPAVPVCTAAELIERLMEQVRPFAADFHLGEQVVGLVRRDDGCFDVRTNAGTHFDARTIVVAGGVGAFEPVRLKLEGIDAFEGTSVYYSVKDPARHEGRHVVVLGGGDSALDWAIALVDRARTVTILHRRHAFRAQQASVDRAMALAGEGRLRLLYGNVSAYAAGADGLESVEITTTDGGIERIPAEHLLVFFGLSPKLGPIAEWGLALDKDKIEVETSSFRTSVPGIYAIGDINTYPGKKKLILSGFHEAALAAFGIKQHLNPGAKVHLQYSTTSSAIHKRLGVE